MHSVTLLLGLAFLAGGSSAQSACTGPQYNDIPGFPTSNSACYPTNYYQTYDLGQTSPSDAKTRCQQYCTNAGGSCQSVVAQVNKAADSNLYSGTCFLYAPGQTVTPRACASPAYMLQGYMKDSTNACFSSSSVSASKFCSSYLNIPVNTVTTTTTLPVTTTTKTVTSVPTVSQTITVTPVSVLKVTATTTVTVSTTTVTVPSTTTFTTQTTTVVTSTITSTITVTAAAQRRRDNQVKRAANTVPPPACVSSGTPATRLSAACSCLSVTTSTTTSTKTPPQVTSTATSTTVVPTTTTVTNTAAASITTTTTTTTTGVTATQTTTSVFSSTITQTVTSTTVLTTTSTTTTVTAPTCTGGLHVAQGDGEVWNGQCNFNYYGGTGGSDVSNIIYTFVNVQSLNDCIDLCAGSYGSMCQAVDWYSYRGNSSPSNCYCLYGTSYGGTVANSIDSAVLIG